MADSGRRAKSRDRNPPKVEPARKGSRKAVIKNPRSILDDLRETPAVIYDLIKGIRLPEEYIRLDEAAEKTRVKRECKKFCASFKRVL